MDDDYIARLRYRSWNIDWKNTENWAEAADKLHLDLIFYRNAFTQGPLQHDFWEFYFKCHSNSLPNLYVGDFIYYYIEGTDLVVMQSVHEDEEGSYLSTSIIESSDSESDKSSEELLRPYIPALIDTFGLDPQNPPNGFDVNADDNSLTAYLGYDMHWKDPAKYEEASDILHSDLILYRTAITQTPFYKDFWKFYSEQHSDDSISKDYSVRSAYHPVEGHELEINQYLGEDDKGAFISISIRKSWGSQSQEPVGELMRPYALALIDRVVLDPDQLPPQFTPEYDGMAFGELGWYIDWKEHEGREQASNSLHYYLHLYQNIISQTPLFQDFWDYYANRHPNDSIPQRHPSVNVYHHIENTEFEIAQYVDIEQNIGLSIRKRWNSQAIESVGELMRPYTPALIDALGLDPKQLPSEFTPEHYEPIYWGRSSLDIEWQNPSNQAEAADWLHKHLQIYRDILSKPPARQS